MRICPLRPRCSILPASSRPGFRSWRKSSTGSSRCRKSSRALAQNFKAQPADAPKGAIVLDQPASPSATVSIVAPNAAVSTSAGR